MRRHRPDFIVLVDDGNGDDNLLHLAVEIKGYQREDSKEKKSSMNTYWIPGVNNIGAYDRCVFAEFTDTFMVEENFRIEVDLLLSLPGIAVIEQILPILNQAKRPDGEGLNFAVT